MPWNQGGPDNIVIYSRFFISEVVTEVLVTAVVLQSHPFSVQPQVLGINTEYILMHFRQVVIINFSGCVRISQSRG